MSAGWTSRVVLSGVAAAALAATAFAVAVNSHAQAPKHPEYHKTGEDGALRKPLKKGLKAKGSGERAKTQRGITDCEGYTYMGQQILGTSCRAK